MRIKLVSAMVDDQDRALAFYTDVLGFVKKHDILLGGPYRWITVTSPEGPGDVELVLEPNAMPEVRALQLALVEQGTPYLAFEVDDVDAEYERLRGRGVSFTTEPVDQGPIRLAIFADGVGNLVQIYAPTGESP